jgi:hypothetical protein
MPPHWTIIKILHGWTACLMAKLFECVAPSLRMPQLPRQPLRPLFSILSYARACGSAITDTRCFG